VSVILILATIAMLVVVYGASPVALWLGLVTGAVTVVGWIVLSGRNEAAGRHSGWALLAGIVGLAVIAAAGYALLTPDRRCTLVHRCAVTPTTSPSPSTTLNSSSPPMVHIAEFPVPSQQAQPGSITTGPDGNIWFTEANLDRIGRMSPDGRNAVEFPFPSGSVPAVIINGPGNYLWVMENANAGGTRQPGIARVTTSGVITEHLLPRGANLVGIAPGPDGNIWFTRFDNNTIDRMSPDGAVTGQYPIPTPDSGPAAIVPGPDGNLWFDEQRGHQIARISPIGQISEFRYAAPPVPNTDNNHSPTSGPDGNVWFTDFWNSRIGYVTPAGQVTEFPTPTAHSLPLGIVAGRDGYLWFTECVPDSAGQSCVSDSKIGRSDVHGQITEFALPVPTSGPAGITVDQSGAIWFTETFTAKIGRITLS
jgi:streptogramin lyase